jgi:hypothetical protein
MNYFQSEQARAAKLTTNSIEYVSFKVPKRVFYVYYIILE